MKVTIAFLLVAVSCHFGDANKAKCVKCTKVPSNIPKIPRDCLNKLLKVDVPETLEKLQNLLCKFMQGKKENNEQLYKEFLMELHTALIDAGCTVDQILNQKEFVEKLGDEVGKVAEELGFEVLKAVESLGLGDIVMNTVCGLLGETLKTLSESLRGLNLNLNVASGGLSGLPVLGGLLG